MITSITPFAAYSHVIGMHTFDDDDDDDDDDVRNVETPSLVKDRECRAQACLNFEALHWKLWPLHPINCRYC